MDQSAFAKVADGGLVADDCMMHQREIVFNPVAQSYGMSKHDPSNTSNVCKVKPQQQAVMSTGHSPLSHSGPSPLSPPPFSSNQPMHFNYPQAGMSGSPAQFGNISTIPAVPSPPAGLYSTQQLPFLPPMSLEGGHIPGRYPYIPLPTNLKETSSLNQGPVYHQYQPSDIFASLSLRVQQPPAHPNPNTVLLTSSANTLMSGSVKQSSQNIGVIGSKAPHFLRPYDTIKLGVNQGFLSGSGMVQPVQQPAPNFYANSPAPQTGLYNASNSHPIPIMQQAHNPSLVNQSNALHLQKYLPPLQFDMNSYHNPGNASCMKSGVGNNSVTKEVLPALNCVLPLPRLSMQVNQNQLPPQQSPTQPSGNKFVNYPNSNIQLFQAPQQGGSQQRAPQGSQSNVSLQGNRSGLRYPNPIQRPMTYRGRPLQQQRSAGKAYYDGSDGKAEETVDLGKADEGAQLNCEPKMSDPVPPGKPDAAEEVASTAKE